MKTLREAIDAAIQRWRASPFLLRAEGDHTLAYGALSERMQLVAIHLRGMGLVPGDRVAFMLENGVATVEIFLALVHGGFVAVPLDVRAGRAGLAERLAAARARVVFADPAHAETIRHATPEDARLSIVPTHPDDGASWPDPTPAAAFANAAPAPPSPEDAAVLNFTSGTSGRPRGVLHRHDQLLSSAWAAAEAHALRGDDRAPCVLPLYHVNAQTTILLPTLLTGGSLVVPRRFERARYWHQVARHDCSWLPLVPAIIAQLLAPAGGDAPRIPTGRLRFARSSSAPLAPAQHRAFEARFGIPLLEMMGATEAGGLLFSNPAPDRQGKPGARKIGSVGIPWRVDARIVDPEGREVAAGATGEIAIRGPRLIEEYEGAASAPPPRTLDGFVLTGDLGHRDADGFFFVTGRSKEIVIKGGHKIAPREIDDVLAQHPGVREAAAVGVPDRWFGETIVAFVVAEPGAACDEEALLDHCERELGPLRTPDRIGIAEELPRGPSGKLQRLRLREPAQQLLISRSPVAPLGGRTLEQLERDIASVWAEALGLSQVDRNADFFALGGYSLLALQVSARLRRRRGIELDLGDFFSHPTVARQAERAAARAAAPAAAISDLALTRAAGESDAPLSRGQERLWLLERLESGAAPYNEAAALRLRGGLRADLLERSLRAIQARHSVLRVAIEEIDGSPRQRVRNDRPLELERIDLGPEVLEPEGAGLRELVQRRFELGTGSLLRATLIRVAADDHVLLLCLHHLVCDTWSFDLLFRELSALYTALAAGESPLLPPLPIQFADYARWEREQPARKPADAALAYWRQKLSDAPDTPVLPVDRPRPDRPSGRGETQTALLGPATTQALRALAQREGATLFMLLVALWQALLHRWTGRDDLVLGTPVTRRTRDDLESLIGFFVDTQVLRMDTSDDPAFLELLARARAEVAGACAHPLPFEEVVAALRPERNAQRTPFVEVMLNYRDVPRPLPALPGLEALPIGVHNGCAKFELTLSVVAGAEGLETRAEYATDLFERATIERLLRCFSRLAEAVAEDPARPLSCLPLLSDDEQEEILALGRGPRVAYPRDTPIPALFASVARRAPDAIAARFETGTLTYSGLDARANQLANRLQELGVGPDVLVGVALERSPELLITLVGILKAGGAYVPLDPGEPPARLAHLLGDTRAPLIATLERHEKKLRGALRLLGAAAPAPVLLRLDTDAREIEVQPRVAPPCPSLTAEHLAYVLYTSGSSGVPKGVCVPHRAVVRLVTTAGYVQLGEGEVLLAYAPLGFDASTLEIWGALLSGACLAVFPPRLGSLDELGRFIEEAGVTTLWLTAGLFQLMVETQLARLRGVRQLLSGGDVLSPSHARRLCEALPELTLVNGYGPTEATVFTCCHVMRGDAPPGPRVPIGRPIANAEVLILDGARRPVPIGVAGEVYIGGDGLARGYLREPALTGERFVAHPFAPGERLYRSGDLARWRPDGTLDFLGRCDAQLKVRGLRIEPGEIESALAAHPGVREAAVVARGGDASAKELVAFIVGRDGEAPAAGDVQRFLEERLPARLVPRSVVPLPSLPLTPNGKLDRRALGKLAARPRAETEYVAPRSEAERQIAKAFEAALGIPRVGVEDDFFALGGHSLLALRVHARINRILRSNLPLTAFFQTPTAAGLAQALGEKTPDTARSTLITLSPKGTRPPLFCVHGTVGFRRLARHLGPDQPLFSLAQGFDENRLATRVEQIAARYLAALRSQQREGPYALIGFSMGGLIALEMARRLQAEGEEIRLLALVDPSKLRLEPRPRLGAWQRLRRRRRRKRSLAQRVRIDLLRLSAGLFRTLRRPLPPRLRTAYLDEIVFRRVYRRAARAHAPSAYPGRILLFASQDRSSKYLSDWAQIAAGGVEVHRVPGDHLDLLGERAIAMVAEQLAPRLDPT